MNSPRDRASATTIFKAFGQLNVTAPTDLSRINNFNIAPPSKDEKKSVIKAPRPKITPFDIESPRRKLK